MARGKTEQMKQRLLQEREELLRQREALDNEIKGIERAIALVSAEEPAASKGKRPQLKQIVLDLLDDVGTTGLDASSAVSLANDKGQTIERNSVSSLLSRLKRDEVVDYDGRKYRLKKYAPKTDDGDPFGLRVVPRV